MNKAMLIASFAVIGVALSVAAAQAQGTVDKIEGTATGLKGSAEETVGKATGDTKLEWQGKSDRVKGAVQSSVGDLKNTAGDVKDKMTR